MFVRFWKEQPVLVAVTVAALLFGIYARFKGLGIWPLAADEYYTARSVQNVLRGGLPASEWGSIYPRGLLLVYLAASLQLSGMSAELAPRLIAALSTLATLAAVYVLGQRAHSRTIGLLAVTILALSIWEVEMSRFGRMYAPFQAVFAWYLVYFLKYTVDREQRAVWAMLVLSIVGVLTWEGGVFLALANCLPPFLNHASGRLSARDGLYLACAALLFLLIAWFTTTEFRPAGSEPHFPADYDASLNRQTLVDQDPTVAPWTTLVDHPLWATIAVIPLGVALLAMRWVWAFRARWPAASGLLVALVAALLHQFAAFAAAILLLLMLRLLHWKEMFTRAALPFLGAVILSVAFWTAFGLLTNDWRDYEGIHWLGNNKVVVLVYEFVRFPDLLREIVRPWASAVPILGLALAVLIAVGIIRTIVRNADGLTAERVMQVVLVCMVLAAAATGPPRHVTRYVFFVYPMAVIVALTAVAWMIEAASHQRRLATAFIAIAALGGFALTEDFQPEHLLKIDSARVIGGEESHYHPRTDPRVAADWLAEHAANDQDLVINGSPGVDFYFSKFDFTYMDWRHRRFEVYARRRGTVDRWGNLPLLYTVDALEFEISKADRAYLVIDAPQLEGLMRGLARWQPQVVWTSIDGEVTIVRFKGTRKIAATSVRPI